MWQQPAPLQVHYISFDPLMKYWSIAGAFTTGTVGLPCAKAHGKDPKTLGKGFAVCYTR